MVALLEDYSVSIVGEVYVKDTQSLSKWVYSDAIALITQQFEAQMRAAQVSGIMILDARTKNKNVPSVHVVTTSRFKRGGDPFQHLVESPVFGHSDAHVVLQLADILVSALLFPMACAGFCNSLIDNVHIDPKYDAIRERYGQRLRLLESRYLDARGRRVGGIRVNDYMNRQPSLGLYQEVPFVPNHHAKPRRPLAPDALQE